MRISFHYQDCMPFFPDILSRSGRPVCQYDSMPVRPWSCSNGHLKRRSQIPNQWPTSALQKDYNFGQIHSTSQAKETALSSYHWICHAIPTDPDFSRNNVKRPPDALKWSSVLSRFAGGSAARRPAVITKSDMMTNGDAHASRQFTTWEHAIHHDTYCTFQRAKKGDWVAVGRKNAPISAKKLWYVLICTIVR